MTLNARLSRVISNSGHIDRIVVTDAGLLIPPGVKRIDLASRPGSPSFLDTVLAEMAVEGAIASVEIAEVSPTMLVALHQRLTPLGVELELVPHVDFKARTADARAAVRSGEFTPFANVILIAGVVF